MVAILCDSQGNRQCGSDGIAYTTARSPAYRLKHVRDYRTRFKANFPHKFAQWTHCFFVTSVQAWDGKPGKVLYAL